MHSTKRVGLILAGGLVIGACQDLNVPNYNQPSVEAALATPGNVETAVGSAFKTWIGALIGDDVRQGVAYYPVVGLSGLGGELAGGGNVGAWNEVAGEPRREYNNVDAGQWFNRLPYQLLTASLALSTDVVKVLDAGTVKLGTVDATYPNGRGHARAYVWAKMIQGASLAYLGIYFDKSRVIDEHTPVDPYSTDFKPYGEVLAAGIKHLEEAAALARANAADTLRTPTNWVNGCAYSFADAEKIANSLIVRAMVYGARTPAERAALDWNRINTLLDNTVRAASFSYRTGTAAGLIWQADNTIRGTRSTYVNAVQLQTDLRPSNYILGPADTSGRYQTWLTTPIQSRTAFIVATPDRRIHGSTGPTSSGTVFRYLTSQTMSNANGTYMHSNYRSIKYGTNSAAYNTAVLSTMTPQEMDFLKAEALIRLNRAAEALPIINASRATGGLPAATVTGVAGGSCVPRKDSGACGDLWDVLYHEKRMMLYGVEATIAFADARGFGKLLTGSMIHLPVPGRELQTLGMQEYSYGGSLPGSAP